jgi:hypothetical protein
LHPNNREAWGFFPTRENGLWFAANQNIAIGQLVDPVAITLDTYR